MALDKIKKDRIRKLERIKKSGKNPYPISFKKPQKIKEALSSFKAGKNTVLA